MSEKHRDFQRDAGNRPEDDQNRDWRIGLTVKPKYRSDPLYYETGIVLDAYPPGWNGIVCSDGVLKIKLDSGRVILRDADEWITT